MDPWVYVVLLGIAVMVYAILLPNRNTGKEQQAIGEIEEVLDQFADVMEEDNRELLDTVNGWRRELEADLNRLNGRLDALAERVGERSEPRPDEAERHHATAAAAEPATAGVVETPARPVKPDPAADDAAPASGLAAVKDAASGSDAVAATGMRGRYPQLFAWHDAGKSVEYIAKKSGMNKGEVMLILQLAKREEQRGV